MPDKSARHSALHIIAPGICGPLADISPLASKPVITRWIKTLSRAHNSVSAENTHALLAALSGQTFNNDFPSAVFTLLANDLYDPDRFYMHADPVHLQADIDSALLTPGADLNISEAEAEGFCQTLNQHFAEDGLTFLALNNNRWFVSSKEEIKLETTSLLDATGRNINYLLPAGEDAVRWKQMLTEAQMLLHAHELNENRENTGLASINSLWFHGSGQLPENFPAQQAHSEPATINHVAINHVCSNDDLLKGFSRFIKCEYMALPDSVNAYTDYLLSCDTGVNNVLHLDTLQALTNYTDVQPWLAQLETVLHNWLYPLLSFSNKNNIKVTLYPCTEKQYRFEKSDVLKFWRKDPLEKHVKRY